jgi:hypothetical protein
MPRKAPDSELRTPIPGAPGANVRARRWRPPGDQRPTQPPRVAVAQMPRIAHQRGPGLLPCHELRRPTVIQLA